MSFVVLANWDLSDNGLMLSGQPVAGPEPIYNIEKDTVFIILPENVRAYDMQMTFDPIAFSPRFENPKDLISIIHNDQEKGILSVIAESGDESKLTIAYDLNDQETNVTLYVQAYGPEGNIMSNMLKTIEINAVPEEFSLSQNYPNPFNPVTNIEYGLPVSGNVRLTIYDLLGREIVRLVDGMNQAGYRSVRWDGKNNVGNSVGAGMYLYAIQAGEFRQVRKMILLK